VGAAPSRRAVLFIERIGAQQVIAGMEEGLTGLEAGEETTLAIPPEKAYGERSEEKSRSTRPTT